MKKLEYSTLDKSKWGPGPWQQEPDKVQWQDDATGLPCLMVRNHGGAWCGYVGVAEGHPLFAKEYGACVWPEKHEAHETDGYHYNCSPQAHLEAHGGITFTSYCSEMDEAAWKRWQGAIPTRKAEAAKYPIGDSARWLREWEPVLSDYTAWKERYQSVGICHLPEADEPDRVWWFGFDCAHSGDMSPGYDREFMSSLRDGAYRDAGYAQREVESLAKQLKALV